MEAIGVATLSRSSLGLALSRGPSVSVGNTLPTRKCSALSFRRLGGGFVVERAQRERRARHLSPCKAALEPSNVVELARAAVTSAHGIAFTLADAANDAAIQVAASAAAATASDAVGAASDMTEAASTFVKQQDWLTGLADGLEVVLKWLESGLASLHVPYAYGFSIILLTFLVKAATYPLTKQQVESTLAMQNLAPKIKTIQTKYQGDQERIQLETARLYQQAGVNPLAGCLPTLATIPVWIALYRTLSNVAQEGILTEGFFWIPSLAGPTSLDKQAGGSGLAWLFPLIDGHPPLGWAATAAYLVLPLLLVGSQYFSMQMMQTNTNDPAQKQTQAILKFLPLMIGYFSLSVPSGLSLYWLTNNVLSTAQQIYLKQLGGAKPVVDKDGSGIIDAGTAKRSSVSLVATEEEKEKERLRGEKFRAIKEAELAKKAAARKAAEESSQAGAAKEQETRDRLRVQAGEGGSSAEDDDEDEDDDEFDVPDVAPAKVGANGKPVGKRSKRSKRTRKVA